MKTKHILLSLIISMVSIYGATNPMHIGFSVVYSIQGESWSDVNDEIKSAISEEGIVISYTSHASTMLNRTAKSIGTKKPVYKHAQIHLFCQASMSHKMVKANPHIISGCPYGISVYQLAGKKNTIYVSYRKYPKEEEGYKDVVKLQDSIVRNALGL